MLWSSVVSVSMGSLVASLGGASVAMASAAP